MELEGKETVVEKTGRKRRFRLERLCVCNIHREREREGGGAVETGR